MSVSEATEPYCPFEYKVKTAKGTKKESIDQPMRSARTVHCEAPV